MLYRIFFVFIITTLFSCVEDAHSSFLFPVYERDWFAFYDWYKVGYVDTSGNKVIAAKFVRAEPFTEGLGCVAVAEGNGYLYGYIDSSGNFIIPPKYYRARSFHNNRAFVCDEPGKCGFIDIKGNPVTEMIFHYLTTDFDSSHAIVYMLRGTAPAEKNIAVEILTLGIVSGGSDAVYDLYELDYNSKLTLLVSGTTDESWGNKINTLSQNNIGVCSKDSMYGFIHIDEYMYKNGEFWGGAYDYYDKRKELFIPPVYKRVTNFAYGYAKVEFANGDKGYIDTTGKTVVRFEDASPFMYDE